MTTTTNRKARPIPMGPIQTQTARLNFDVPLLLVTFTLVLFGILMLYSASWDFSYLHYEGDATHMFTRQLTWLPLGLGAAAFTTLLDYHYYRRLAVPGMLVTLVGLIAVLIINDTPYGAARTFSKGSFMPAEAAKLATIIYLAVWLYAKRNVLSDVNLGLLPLGGIIGLMSGLILAQPDLSAAATIIFLGGLLFFLAGGELKQIAVLLILTVLIGWVVVQIHPTGNARIASYLEGIENPTLASDHVLRSLEAFIKGGFFGVGIGMSNTKLTGLPVPPTDSIFAVIAEETGIFGTSILIMLYCILIWRGIRIALNAPDALGSMLAGGLTLWIGMEAFINMGVMVGLLPFAGNALPFISAGGSSLMVTLTSIGILLNISRLSNQAAGNERKTHAFNGVRRGDSRRRQSRAGRAASTR